MRFQIMPMRFGCGYKACGRGSNANSMIKKHCGCGSGADAKSADSDRMQVIKLLSTQGSTHGLSKRDGPLTLSSGYHEILLCPFPD